MLCLQGRCHRRPPQPSRAAGQHVPFLDFPGLDTGGSSMEGAGYASVPRQMAAPDGRRQLRGCRRHCCAQCTRWCCGFRCPAAAGRGNTRGVGCVGRGGQDWAGAGLGGPDWADQPLPGGRPAPLGLSPAPQDRGRQGARRQGCMGLPRDPLFWLLLLLVASCSGILFALFSSEGEPHPGPRSRAR